MIPFINFGGSGRLIHFANANGYPARTYTPLIETLTPHYRVLAMVNRAQWPSAQASDLKSWDPFVDDFLQFLDEQGAEPVIGVGHSLGAAVTLSATPMGILYTSINSILKPMKISTVAKP